MLKKCIGLFLAISLVSFGLCGCGSKYKDAVEYEDGEETICGGYFVVLKEWGGAEDNIYKIVYAKDTKVKYFVVYHDEEHISFQELYNRDQSLQYWSGE